MSKLAYRPVNYDRMHAFLKANKGHLENFNLIDNPFWASAKKPLDNTFSSGHPDYKSTGPGNSQKPGTKGNAGDLLKDHIDLLLRVAEEDHRLFDWLRGEYDPDCPDSKVPATVN